MRRGLNFAISIYLARVLGASGFGLLAFAQAIMAYLSLVAALGLPRLGEREIARSHEDVPKYVNAIIPLRLVLGLGAYLILVVLVLILSKGYYASIFILLYGLVLFTRAFNLDWVFRGTEKMQFLAIFEMVSGAVYLALIPLLVAGYEYLLHVALIVLLSHMVGELILIVCYRRSFGAIRLRFNTGFWKKLLKTSFPLGFSFLMGMLYFNFDVVMLSLIKGDAATGIYSAAAKFMIIALLIPNLLVDSVFPAVSRLYKEDRKQALRLIRLGTRLLYSLGIPLAVGIWLLADDIIALFYGTQYYASVWPLKILAVAVGLMFISGMAKHFFVAMNDEIKFLTVMTGATIVNIGINAVLIPMWGPEGAAMATIIAEIFALVYCVVQLRSIIDTHMLGVLGASGVMGIVVILTKSVGLAVAVPVGTAAYFFAVFVFRGIRLTDVRNLRKQIFTARNKPRA